MINFVQETEGFLKKRAILTGAHPIYLFEVPILKGQSLAEQVTEKGDDSTQSDSRRRQPASKDQRIFHRRGLSSINDMPDKSNNLHPK